MKEVKEKYHVGFWVDYDTHVRLKYIAERRGKNVSDILREMVEKLVEQEANSTTTIIDAETVMEIFGLSDEEVAEELKSGGWGGVKPDEVLGHAIAWAQKRYPGMHWEIGIFATIIEGFATGMWGGFGQDNDELFQEAYRRSIQLVGGTPPNELGIAMLPMLTHKKKVLFAKELVEFLEGFLFQGSKGAK